MASLLTTLVNNLFEEIHKTKYKYQHYDKICETYVITYQIGDYFFEYTNFKNDLIQHNCLCCNKIYQQKFDENLKKHFYNTYKFSTTTIISLFYCCKKVFILMNIW